MKAINQYLNLAVFLWVLGLCNGYSQQLIDQKFVVLLDPGHGGSDSGACSLTGTMEKDIVLQVVNQMLNIQRDYPSSSLELLTTRQEDTLLKLGVRSQMAIDQNVDFFMSIHCNYAASKNAQGIEVFTYWSPSKVGKISILYAFGLVHGMSRHLDWPSRGVKFANFKVLRDLDKTVPSVLVELGFLSHPEEGILLAKPETIRDIAQGLYYMLNQYSKL